MADGTVKIDVILDDSKVSGGVKKVEGRLGGIASSAKRGIATVGKLAGALGLVGLAYKGIDMVKNSLDGAIDRYDTLNQFPRVMALMGFDAEESEKAINKLSDGIQGLPTRLDEVASTAQNIAIMTGDLDGAVDTTLALNNAFLASGASTADAERGLRQYVNMLAKGEVDAMRWETLQETMGVALNKVAEAFGFAGESAQNDLYDALKSGEITFDEFNNKIIELSEQTGGFADIAQEASKGLKTSLGNLNTWILTGVADVIGAIDKALGGTGEIADAIDRLKPIVQGVFGWIANTAIPAVAAAIQFLIELFNEIKMVVMEWIGENESGLQYLAQIYQEYFLMIWEYVQQAFMFIKGVVEEILPPIVEFIRGILEQILSFYQENGQQIIEAVKNAFEFIKSIVEFIMPVVRFIVQDVWDSIKNIIQSALDIILGIIKTFSSLFTGDWEGFWEGIKQLLSGAVQAIWGLLNLWFLGRVIKLGKTFFSLFRNLFTNGFNFIRNLVTNSLNAIRNTFSNILNGLKNIVSRAFNGVRSAVSGGMRNAFNAVVNFLGRFKDAGRRIVTSIADGIKGAIGKVTDAISGVTQKIRNFLPFSPAKEGALRDIMDIQIAESIAEAIEKGESKAVQSMRSLAGKLIDEADVDLLGDLKGISVNGVMSRFMPTTAYGGITNNRTNNRSIEINLEYHGSGSREDAENMIDIIDRALEDRASLQLFMKGER